MYRIIYSFDALQFLVSSELVLSSCQKMKSEKSVDLIWENTLVNKNVNISEKSFLLLLFIISAFTSPCFKTGTKINKLSDFCKTNALCVGLNLRMLKSKQPILTARSS